MDAKDLDTSTLPRVAIIGRANVGKSTLFNRLVRDRRSLVEDRPGVTRDRVACVAEVEGRPVLLVDTGGLDPDAESGIPAAISRQVAQVLRDASVVVFVVSARDGVLATDRQVADLLRREANSVVLAVNKSDGPLQDIASGEFHGLGFDEVLPVSAEHNRGLRDLEIAIAERLPALAAPAVGDASVRIALVGRPNVGKSSLLNRLIGAEQNIVSNQPGTTRDATDTQLTVGDRVVTLIDTAGLRRPAKRSDHVERGSAYQSLRAVERAHVALLLLDAIEGVTEQDARIARLALDRGRGLVLVTNKWDAVADSSERDRVRRELSRRLSFVPEPEILEISAKTGKGTKRVLPRALALYDSLRRSIPTAEVNRVLREAIAQNAPAVHGRKRARFFYATQTASVPMTILVFVNNPDLVPRNYHRYLESRLRRAFQIRSAPLRLLLRRRSREDERDAGLDREGGDREGDRGAESEAAEASMASEASEAGEIGREGDATALAGELE